MTPHSLARRIGCKRHKQSQDEERPFHLAFLRGPRRPNERRDSQLSQRFPNRLPMRIHVQDTNRSAFSVSVASPQIFGVPGDRTGVRFGPERCQCEQFILRSVRRTAPNNKLRNSSRAKTRRVPGGRANSCNTGSHSPRSPSSAVRGERRLGPSPAFFEPFNVASR